MSYIGNQPVIQSTEFREEYFPTASQTAFVTGGFHPSAVSVTRNGVLLSESDYTKGTDNVTITLNSAAISGDVVVIRGNRSLVQGVAVSESRVEYTWQSGDTVVQLNADVVPFYSDVYLNGVKLAAADYTINTVNRTVSFTSAPAVGDVIAVVHRNETSALVGLPIKDSYGNEVLSQSGNAVSIGTLRLPTSGGIQDSQGANVLSESANVVTLTADEANVGSNALVVDSSGKCGIGTDSPAQLLHLKTDSTGSTRLRIENSEGNAEICTDGTHGFLTAGGTEILRFKSDGNVLVGTTTAGLSNSISTSIEASGLNNSRIYVNHSSGGSSNSSLFMGFGYGGNQIGSITQNSTTSTAFNSNSDYRLKENITEITDGINRVKQLNPSRFNFIADPNRTVDGFIAHEVSDVVPEAISGEKDAVNEDGSIDPQGIDQSKLVPLLTAALQESITLIESLQATVADLTARIEALEATP